MVHKRKKVEIGFSDLLDFVNNEELANWVDMKKVDNIELKGKSVILEDWD